MSSVADGDSQREYKVFIGDVPSLVSLPNVSQLSPVRLSLCKTLTPGQQQLVTK